MMDAQISIDRGFGFHEEEDHIVMSGTLTGDTCRIHIDYDVWRLVLAHFELGAQPTLPEDGFIAMEHICALVIEKRGFPQYGVLRVSLD